MPVIFYVTIIVGMSLIYYAYLNKQEVNLKEKELEVEMKKIELELERERAKDNPK